MLLIIITSEHKREKKTNHIDAEFDRIFNYELEKFIDQEYLKSAFPDQNWSPQGSGIQIREKYVPLIKRLWDTFEKSDLTGLSARQ